MEKLESLLLNRNQDDPQQGAGVTPPFQTTSPEAKGPEMPPVAMPTATGPAAGSAKTRLMEGDPTKLADPSHAANSPKYDFLQLANQNKYGYNQMGDMVKELQSGANGRLWQGWAADGKGNLQFTGDPSQLAPEWKGVKSVDAVGAYGNMAQGKDAAGWRWGVDDPGAQPAAAGAGAPSGGIAAPYTPDAGVPVNTGGDQAPLQMGAAAGTTTQNPDAGNPLDRESQLQRMVMSMGGGNQLKLGA